MDLKNGVNVNWLFAMMSVNVHVERNVLLDVLVPNVSTVGHVTITVIIQFLLLTNITGVDLKVPETEKWKK